MRICLIYILNEEGNLLLCCGSQMMIYHIVEDCHVEEYVHKVKVFEGTAVDIIVYNFKILRDLM